MRARAQKSGKVYYYLDAGEKPRRELPLGADYFEAIKKYALLKQEAPASIDKSTLATTISEYFKSRDYDELSPRTQRDYQLCQVKVLEFFNQPPAPLACILPMHIEQFMQWRGESSKRRANYERALISLVWNYARRKGLTNKSNPCEGVKRFKLDPRDVYVEDAIYDAVYEMSTQPVRDAMDLAYLTGQRPIDVFAMSETDIADGMLSLVQTKTGRRLRIVISGELETLLKRIATRKKQHHVYSLALICNERGARITQEAIAQRFSKLRPKVIAQYPKLKEALQKFQFRDLRAKAATDVDEERGRGQAQKLLGHASSAMTDDYIRARKGESVNPTK